MVPVGHVESSPQDFLSDGSTEIFSLVYLDNFHVGQFFTPKAWIFSLTPGICFTWYIWEICANPTHGMVGRMSSFSLENSSFNTGAISAVVNGKWLVEYGEMFSALY